MRFPKALLPLIALTFVACHRNRTASPAISTTGSTDPTATATPPSPPSPPSSSLDPGVLAILRRYLLTQADLPAGYSIGGQLELPNGQVARDYADPDAALQEIQDTGRQGGLAQQIFAPGAGSGGVGVSIELFRDLTGAQRWVASPPDLPSALNAVPAALDKQVGEQSAAFHWTRGSQSGYVLNFRRGRVVFGLGIAAPSGQESLETLMTVAQRFDDKAQQ